MKGKLAITVKKWLAGSLATMLVLGIVSGCQPVFLSKEVYEQAHSKQNMLPAKFEDVQTKIAGPITSSIAAPATVDMPERRPRYLTLQEAIAQSLENGTPSGRVAEGRGDTNLPTFPGPGSLNSQTDRIRVLAMNPAISAAAMEASLARFDAVAVTGMNWTNTDNLQQGLSSFNNGQGANFNSSIIKAFADGSIANISFITNYTNLNVPPAGQFSVLNPQYTPRLSFGYEAPLWRDSGVDINQLLSRLPVFTGQALTANLAGQGFNTHQNAISGFNNTQTEGILISKLRFDQSRTEFERNVQIMVKNVEIAYWNLYNKYGQLFSFEENLRILQRAYQESKYKFDAGVLDPYKFYQTRGQYEEFRANRIQALQEVLDAERNLRIILGLPMEDGDRLIPITPPSLAQLRPDWEQCLQDTLNLRPELLLARDNLRYHQYLLTISQNNLKPDLRFFAKYEPVGFGSTLTGSGTFIDGTGTERPTNAFSSLRGMHFADYQLGLFLNVPIGQRAEHAAIRAARMQLSQSYYFLRDMEDKAIAYLTEQYQETIHWHERIKAHRDERVSYVESMNKIVQQIKAGKRTYGDLEFLSVQRSYAAALVKEYNAIAEYNNTLARLEWAKGATLRYNNVRISEGALPECAQINAVEYEKERSRSIVLRQRPDSLAQPGQMVVTKESELFTPMPLPAVNVIDAGEGNVVGPRINGQRDFTRNPFSPRPTDFRDLPTSPAEPMRFDIQPVSSPAPLGPLPMLEPARAPISQQSPGAPGSMTMEDTSKAPFLGPTTQP